MEVFLECRNAEGSVFEDHSVFPLGDFLKWKSFQNAGMKVHILIRGLLEFGIGIYILITNLFEGACPPSISYNQRNSARTSSIALIIKKIPIKKNIKSL